jgi:hypothetical protein
LEETLLQWGCGLFCLGYEELGLDMRFCWGILGFVLYVVEMVAFSLLLGRDRRKGKYKRQNTGILHCVQDDDGKRVRAKKKDKNKDETKGKSKDKYEGQGLRQA